MTRRYAALFTAALFVTACGPDAGFSATGIGPIEVVAPPASLAGQVRVFVSTADVRERPPVDARALASRKALRASVSRDGDVATGAAPQLVQPKGPQKEIHPPRHLQPDFVPGDFIVGASGEPETLGQLLRWSDLGLKCTVEATVEGVMHRLVCTQRDGARLTKAQTEALLVRWPRPEGVRFIELNTMAQATRVPSDTQYSRQWHYGAMSLPQAWDITTGSPDVVVAVLDTGIGVNSDLSANLLPGIDLVTDPAAALDGDGWDDDPTDEAGPLDSRSGGSGWHGTHVAGTIAAQSNNGRGVAGVAWNSRVLPVRVLGKGGGTVFDIAAGIAWATGGTVSNTRRNTTVASIVNMSLGGEGGPQQAYQTVIDAAVTRGAIIVVAAGNDDRNTATARPCNQQHVICVGATDLRDVATPYTNYGREVTVSAPGGDSSRDDDGDGFPDSVYSTIGGNTYGTMVGTSMATPHVAGVVALMRAINPQVSLTEVVQALKNSASPISNCSTACGAGVVDAWKAVRAMSAAPPKPAPPSLSLNVSALVLTQETRAQSLRLTNRGGSTAVVGFYGSGPHVSEIFWDQDGTLTLPAGQTADVVVSFEGSFSSDLDLPLWFASPESRVDFTLRVRAPRPPPSTLVALLYLDANDEWQVAAHTLAVTDGTYGLPEVPVGQYLLVGLSDDDGNGEFDDDEGFGMWPSVDDPQPVRVAAGDRLEGYDFAVAPLH